MKKNNLKVKILISIFILCIFSVTFYTLAGDKKGAMKELGIQQADIAKNKNDEISANVNGVVILQNSVQAQKSIYNAYGINKSDAEVLDELILNEVLYQESKKRGITVSDEELLEFITNQKKSIRLDTQVYEEMMSLWEGMGITEDEYYEMMKPAEIMIIAKGKLKAIMKSDFQKNNKLSDKKEADKKFREEYETYTRELLDDAIIEYQSN